MSTVEEIARAFTTSLRSDAVDGGEMITLPLSLSSGNLVQLYVEKVDTGRWFVTDLGQAAQELALHGVNLETQKAAAASWAELVRSMAVDAPVMREDLGRYELAGWLESGDLGSGVLTVGEAVVRADALRALAPGHRAQRFRDVIVQSAGRRNLSVLVDAPMPTKHGGKRAVSLKVSGEHATYIQAVSGKGAAIDGFDKAQAVFSSAAVPKDELVAVLANRVKLEPWQWETLRDSGTPIMEAELDGFMERLAS